MSLSPVIYTITLNEDTRQLVLPNELKTFGIAYDERMIKINFMIPSSLAGVEFSTKHGTYDGKVSYVLYVIDAEKDQHVYTGRTLLRNESDGTTSTFVGYEIIWTPPAEILSKPGLITLALAVYHFDDENTVFNSEPVSIHVDEGIKVSDAVRKYGQAQAKSFVSGTS